MSEVTVSLISPKNKQGRAKFVDLGRRFSAATPHSVPQLRSEELELLDPSKNPLFEHAKVQLFIAHRDGVAVGRVAACVDSVALTMPPEQGFGPGVGIWGYFDAEDEQVSAALLAEAESWLRGEGLTRALGPISLSMWEEPGLLVKGFDHAPMIMMGHNPPQYQGWIESAGYEKVKRLVTYEADVYTPFSPLLQRVIASGERNKRITIRPIDFAHYERDVRTVLEILNDAWSGNWGFLPFTESEIRYASKKLKPLIKEELAKIAELDGEPVAFMLALPDINQVLTRIRGKLLPVGWLTLLKWIRRPMGTQARVPLMGVRREFHGSRLASQLSLMLVDAIRNEGRAVFGTKRAEFGWILEDNQGMVSISEAIESRINREYMIFGRDL